MTFDTALAPLISLSVPYMCGSGRDALAAIFRAFGNLPRPEPWLPYVFTDIDRRIHGCK
jgi:hypothetical protein